MSEQPNVPAACMCNGSHAQLPGPAGKSGELSCVLGKAGWGERRVEQGATVVQMSMLARLFSKLQTPNNHKIALYQSR